MFQLVTEFEPQVNTDDDPELKELFSVDTFPRVMLWSKRWTQYLFKKIPQYGLTRKYFIIQLRWGETDILNGHRTYNKSQGMTSTNIQLWLKKQLSL